MGLRGPTPLPNNVHRLRGNPSKKTSAQLIDEIRPETKIPECPSHLSSIAKLEWDRVSPELEKLRIISEIDRAALAVYCQAYSRWVEAENNIKFLGENGLIDQTPSGYKQMSVWLQISSRAVEQMHKFMREFGMTPSSRSQVTHSPNQIDIFCDDTIQSPGRFFGK
jgi:P27 family predicted phage terminase small subunit